MPDRPVQSPALREITLHDTRTGEILPLRTREPGKVGIYVCGPTVYGRVHVGNARPFVVFSLLKRFLQHEGYEVTFVANVTDVNDKIYAAAAAAGVASETLAHEMTAHYVADTDGLGLGRPDREPLASATIPEIVALIALLIERGHAYAVDGDVYFSVRSDPALRRAVTPPARGHGSGRGRGGGGPQARSVRLRFVESPEARGGHLLGCRPGAEAVPGGTSSARRWPRRCSASTSRSTAAART